jgi:hypothetical protein
VTFFDVAQKVGHGDRSLFLKQLNLDISLGRFEQNAWVLTEGQRAEAATYENQSADDLLNPQRYCVRHEVSP